MGDVTRIISSIRNGEDAGNGTKELFAVVYEELRAMARGSLNNEYAHSTWQPTSLVNEAFLKLVRAEDIEWQDRIHFFRAAAQAMRRILIDKAREKKTAKRGGDFERKLLSDSYEAGEPEVGFDELDRMLDLEDALLQLECIAPDRAELVRLHFFAGLTLEQCGDLLSVSLSTVERQWRATKAWLRKEME